LDFLIKLLSRAGYVNQFSDQNKKHTGPSEPRNGKSTVGQLIQKTPIVPNGGS